MERPVWESRVEVAGGARRVEVARDGRVPSYAEVVELWRGDATFRAFFSRLLADAPLPAFFWETPPVTAATIGRPFEFVLVGSASLAGLESDTRAFAEHFSGRPDERVVTFENLGGDALLVAPRPEPPGTFAHLAAFARDAPDDLCHALWQAVGEAVRVRLGARRLWVSTSGLGVPWLHVRLDRRPKYYTYGPYRDGA